MQLISYPKSGRTWIRFMLRELGVEDRVKCHHDGFEFNDAACPAHDFNLDGRRALYCSDKIIYLERDARDTIVSLYYQVTGRFSDIFNFDGDISLFIRHSYFGILPLLKFQQMWNLLSKERGIYMIRYEDFQNSPVHSLKMVLLHFDLVFPDREIERAVHSGELENMRKIEQSGDFSEPWLRLRNSAPKVRKGKVGGFSDELSDEDIDFLNDTIILFSRGRFLE